MTTQSDQSLKQQALRKQAEGMLKQGSVQPTHGWLTNTDALSLLHQLASSPGSAADALKLLHELQVHQVELDIQHEQLETSEHELAADLVHCSRLYDFAPVSYFSVTPDGKISRVNVAGAALFGEERAELVGRRVDDYLAPESRPVLEKLAAKVCDGGQEECCDVCTRDGAALHVKAGGIPGESSILLVFVDLSASAKPG